MYRIIVVDDEILALKRFEHIVQKENRVKLIETFSDGLAALDFIKENTIDIAFLDIEMPEINGLELANRMLEIDPYINIMFVTAYDQYALEAFKAHAIGYLLKPLDIAAFSDQISQFAKTKEPRKLKTSSDISAPKSKQLIVRFLGQGVCYDEDSPNTPITFRTAKAYELFALLVHHYKTPLSKFTILDTLFPDADYDKANKLFYVSCSYLRSAFSKLDYPDVLLRDNDNYRINTSILDCDYIKLIEAEKKLTSLSTDELADIASLCEGEYLMGKSYDWSMETKAYVETLTRKVLIALSDKYQKENMPIEAIASLEKYVMSDPCNEEVITKLVKLLVANNQLSRARAVYSTYESKLQDEYGLDANPSIKKLLS